MIRHAPHSILRISHGGICRATPTIQQQKSDTIEIRLPKPVRDPKARKSRTASGRKQAAITDIRIHHIETVPMTTAQYARAVEALAVLIARYEREQPDDPDTA
jgi:hypothetical protein